MAMNMPPPSPRTEKRRLSGTPGELEMLASPSKRVTPSKNRSFFSMGAPDSGSVHGTPRTPVDISRIREQAGSTPRALDRDFLASSSATGTVPAVDFGGKGAVKPSSTPAKSKMFNRRTWTKEENDRLQEGLASFGGPDANLGKNEWQKIAHEFLKDSRTGTQCATHWKMVLKPALLKEVWSPEEDAVIFDCLARGINDWAEVASFLSKRKPKHCRERWNNHLNPSLGKGPVWTAAEEDKLMSAVEAHGTSWSMVARHLPGWSEAAIQQHWNDVVFRNALGGEGSSGYGSGVGVRRGRGGTDTSSSVSSVAGGRGKAKPSTLPVESSGHLLAGRDLITRETEQQGVILTEREKALIDHAFKTGLSAGAGGAGTRVPHPQQELQGAVPDDDGGIGSLTLSNEEEDLFAPLTAALLRDDEDDRSGCSPSYFPPPSPTSSPHKQKQLPDYTSIGDQLGDGWVDDDPALADLYKSLDESLFNEDTFELSFDFDSVDKPSPTCGGGGANTSDQHCKSPPKGWDNQMVSQDKDGSPFRRAAAKAAATLERQFSPKKRASQTPSSATLERQLSPKKRASQTPASATLERQLSPKNRASQTPASSKEREIEAAAATTKTAATQAPSKAVAKPPPTPEAVAGPRVKQGFLRRLLLSMNPKPEKQTQPPFSTVRGCLSEANAPPPASLPAAAGSGSPAGAGGQMYVGGGENQAPSRRGQPLSIALFTQDVVSSNFGGNCTSSVTPRLKHGKAEVKIPVPLVPGSGVPLSSLQANRLS